MLHRVAPLVALLAPSVALAHPGDHAHAGWWHLVTEPDHLAMLAAGAVVAVLVLRKLGVLR